MGTGVPHGALQMLILRVLIPSVYISDLSGQFVGGVSVCVENSHSASWRGVASCVNMRRGRFLLCPDDYGHVGFRSTFRSVGPHAVALLLSLNRAQESQG